MFRLVVIARGAEIVLPSAGQSGVLIPSANVQFRAHADPAAFLAGAGERDRQQRDRPHDDERDREAVGRDDLAADGR